MSVPEGASGTVLAEREQRARSVADRARSGADFTALAKEFSAFAGSLGVEEATLATAWVLANEAITAPIIGPTNEDHLRLSLKALDFEITKEIATRLDEIAPPPPPAHDRSEVDR
ncbi:MAG TPA: aldo/keto reductase [Sphaerochaeta sp.]|nr:aldo/keto reductase [Sphaerochaeta sp.]